MNRLSSRLSLILACAIFTQCTIPALAVNEVLERHLQDGEQQYKDSNYGECIREMNAAIILDPRDYRAYVRRGRAHNQIGEATEGLQDLTRAIELMKPKEDSGVYESRGLSHQMLGDYDLAFKDYRYSLKLDPKMIKSYWRMADIKEGLGEWKAAQSILAEAATVKEARLRAYRKMGQNYSRMGDLQKAIKYLDMALEIAPKDLSSWNSRGQVHYDHRQFAKAEADFRNGLKYSPNSSQLNTNLSAALIEQKKYREAIAFLNPYIERYPASGGAHNNRGVAYECLGKTKEAKADFEAAIKGDPEKPDYVKNHARMAVRTGDSEEAVDDYISLSARASENAPQTDTLRSYRLVIGQYTNVMKLNPAEPAPYYNRAIARFCLGEYAEAHKDFTEFIKLNGWRGESPGYVSALNAIALFHLNKSDEAKAVLKEAVTKSGLNAWSTILVKYMLGQVQEDQLMKVHSTKVQNRARRCIIGLNLLAAGNRKKASVYFRWLCSRSDPDSDEYAIAASSLDRMDGGSVKISKSTERASKKDTVKDQKLMLKRSFDP